jgi:hypothetical protein
MSVFMCDCIYPKAILAFLASGSVALPGIQRVNCSFATHFVEYLHKMFTFQFYCMVYLK